MTHLEKRIKAKRRSVASKNIEKEKARRRNKKRTRYHVSTIAISHCPEDTQQTTASPSGESGNGISNANYENNDDNSCDIASIDHNKSGDNKRQNTSKIEENNKLEALPPKVTSITLAECLQILSSKNIADNLSEQIVREIAKVLARSTPAERSSVIASLTKNERILINIVQIARIKNNHDMNTHSLFIFATMAREGSYSIGELFIQTGVLTFLATILNDSYHTLLSEIAKEKERTPHPEILRSMTNNVINSKVSNNNNEDADIEKQISEELAQLHEDVPLEGGLASLPSLEFYEQILSNNSIVYDITGDLIANYSLNGKDDGAIGNDTTNINIGVDIDVDMNINRNLGENASNLNVGEISVRGINNIINNDGSIKDNMDENENEDENIEEEDYFNRLDNLDDAIDETSNSEIENKDSDSSSECVFEDNKQNNLKKKKKGKKEKEKEKHVGFEDTHNINKRNIASNQDYVEPVIQPVNVPFIQHQSLSKNENISSSSLNPESIVSSSVKEYSNNDNFSATIGNSNKNNDIYELKRVRYVAEPTTIGSSVVIPAGPSSLCLKSSNNSGNNNSGNTNELRSQYNEDAEFWSRQARRMKSLRNDIIRCLLVCRYLLIGDENGDICEKMEQYGIVWTALDICQLDDYSSSQLLFSKFISANDSFASTSLSNAGISTAVINNSNGSISSQANTAADSAIASATKNLGNSLCFSILSQSARSFSAKESDDDLEAFALTINNSGYNSTKMLSDKNKHSSADNNNVNEYIETNNNRLMPRIRREAILLICLVLASPNWSVRNIALDDGSLGIICSIVEENRSQFIVYDCNTALKKSTTQEQKKDETTPLIFNGKRRQKKYADNAIIHVIEEILSVIKLLLTKEEYGEIEGVANTLSELEFVESTLALHNSEVYKEFQTAQISGVIEDVQELYNHILKANNESSIFAAVQGEKDSKFDVESPFNL